MTVPSQLYQPSLALLTDLYQLTMGYGYYKAGLAERQACFHLFFRRHPFGGGYTVACGLEDALDVVEKLKFDQPSLNYLATLTGNDGAPLFDDGFLRYLEGLIPSLDIDAMPEGTLAFPHEPLLRVQGPLLQAQLVETALLCIINFQTLIATKATRICAAARGEPVLEFGLRRAQGIDGALSASRAAYVGGVAATSNVLAGQLHGIPVKGTHAHSWVMAFPNEKAAFEAYAAAMPNNCVFLVDTFDTVEGVQRACEVAEGLRKSGHEMVGIRLDSGDLTYLSQEARKLMDAAGFPQAVVVASNDLDEHLIESLKHEDARITVWGVGTKLATAYDQPALGGVYKLAAIQDERGVWESRVKLSEQAIKVSNPGLLQVRRFLGGPQGAVADAIYDERHPIAGDCLIVDPLDPTRRKRLPASLPHEDLLAPVLRSGARTTPAPGLSETRQRVQDQLALFHDGVKRLSNAHGYPAGLEASLHEHKTQLILEARGHL